MTMKTWTGKGVKTLGYCFNYMLWKQETHSENPLLFQQQGTQKSKFAELDTPTELVYIIIFPKKTEKILFPSNQKLECPN